MLIKIKPVSFRRLESPYDSKGFRSFMAVVDAKDLPKELFEWREINVRDPKTTSKVAKLIRKTIDERPDMFLYRNRGIVVMARSVNFDNQTGSLEIFLEDKKRHGLLDGGHTFKILQEAMDETPTDEWDPVYLKVELLEGFSDLDEIVEVVKARNTATQVKDQSIQNLAGAFDRIKKQLSGQPYLEQINFSEYELDDEDNPKPIDIREVLSYAICFDTGGFNGETHPVLAYSSKQAVLDYFVANEEQMEALLPILEDILRLRDTIYRDLSDTYNAAGGREERGRFGNLTGVKVTEKSPVPLYFTREESKYRIPSSYIYPMLAGFRYLVGKRGGRYYWAQDPFKMYAETKKDLVKRFGERARSLQNPNKLGKDASVWQNCFDVIRIAVLEKRAA